MSGTWQKNTLSGCPKILDHYTAKRSVLMLQGANLWRNPQVFVGSIKASEVLVLSDMRGIQATFDVPPETLTD